ncbi:MAG: single-stranded-DNA-specific exonuclease RecJ [Chloroflexi bacterium]|nr:single-stranded-DNA-specific exonuclease RecJ [Chloroflexota bacterium]
MTREASLPTPSQASRAWRLLPPVPAETKEALLRSSCPPFLVPFLYHRGMESAAQAQAFLAPNKVSHDPFLLPGMERAVPRLAEALAQREPIGIFGDFDVDGVTATALLARALGALGATILAYIPHRVQEGHGLNTQAIQHLARQDVRLLITVDCGITAHREIAEATQAGMDTIVTDHHLAPMGAPQALAVVNPQLPGSRYPFPHLSGAGLAWKLAQALYQALGPKAPPLPPDLLALAALSTVADVAPLVNENRSIVRQGLLELAHPRTPGLRALLSTARLRPEAVDTDAIAWALAPRINAAGRMAHASISYHLLMEETEERAAALAALLEQHNRRRQELAEETMAKASALLQTSPDATDPGRTPLLMVGDPSFSPGVTGLVASRLVEEFYRPAVVVSVGPEVSRGSCRSIKEFDIGTALHQAAQQVAGVLRYGGHRQAAGFTIATPQLPALRERLCLLAETSLDLQALRPGMEIDLEVPLRSLPRDAYRTVQLLAPFGEGNPRPVFLSRQVQVLDARAVGADGHHLRLRLRDGPATWDAIAFRQGQRSGDALDVTASTGRSIDIVYSLATDRWGPEETLQLQVLDFRPSH